MAVVGHGGSAILDGLGNEEAVERVAVVMGKRSEAVEVGRGDWEQGKAMLVFQIGGEVFEAIVFEDEEVLARPDPAVRESDDIFAEMAREQRPRRKHFHRFSRHHFT